MIGMATKEPAHNVLHLTVPFTAEGIAGICSMGDFYQAIGLTVMMESKTLTDVSQVWMNRAQCEGLQEIVKKNIIKQRKHRHLRKYLDSAVAMDWLNYSPVAIPYVPEGQVWVFALDDAKTAIEEYRKWLEENEE